VSGFDAKIEEADRGGAFVLVPADVIEELGGKGRIPVRATFDGIAYRGSIVSMGGARILGLLKAIRTELGKGPGDTVRVTVELDDEERTVTVPADLREALSAAGRVDLFAALSYSHQREHVTWIEEAKRPATRERRVADTVERIGA
jgi:Domain of unknown function (DUF1905)/Bacteriocin-protection, YdeI or OmpD-Associated